MPLPLEWKHAKRGLNVRFFRTAALVNRLGEARKGGELAGFLKQLSKLDLLICDEWGYVPLEREGARLLFQVISDCYERRSVVITTNLEFSRWAGIFYDEQMTAAIIDRLVHHSYLLIFDGQSYQIESVYFDNGKQYRTKWMTRTCSKLGIRLLFAKPYSPEATGYGKLAVM